MRVIDCATENDVLSMYCTELKKNLKLLVDTGAQLCLIKETSIPAGSQISVNGAERRMLKGVTSEAVSTLGTVRIHLGKSGEVNVGHKFHVFGAGLDIPYDGLIGRDFLRQHRAQIDYAGKRLRLQGQEIPLLVEKEPGVHEFDVQIGPREEKILRLKVDSKVPLGSEREMIIPKQEIMHGVYVPEALVNVRNGQCIVSVMNLSEDEAQLSNVRLLTEVLEPLVRVRQMKGNDDVRAAVGNRASLLRQQLRTEHLNAEEKGAVLEVCAEYGDVFHLPGDKLTHTSTVKHSIPIAPEHQGKVVNARPYRIPEAQKVVLREQIEQMLEDDIIVESKSAWNAPLLLVPKKADASGKQKWRIVVDYRKLNDITVGDAFPLPHISEILDQLGQAKYFSTLDLASGYYQILTDEKDREKTAFSSNYQHYEYKRMPMGLKGAPGCFQRLMNTVLSGLQGIKCFVYLDDVVCYGRSLKEHNEKLRAIFDRLREHNLKLQPDKCEFLRKEVIFLGHCITDKGIKPDMAKVEKVKFFPLPRTTKELKGFLGLVGYYRKFIAKFSKIAKPLHELLKKGVAYNWGERQNNAFEELKERLINPPILQYPDFTKPFIVTTDASNEALGAVLSQGEKIGEDLPVAYASRSLNKAEMNYSTTEKELLAIVFSVKQFRPYIYGRRFTVVTDHKPLTWIFRVNDPSSRLLKWRLKLEEYDYEVIYKQGKLNSNADALSRIRSDEQAHTDKDQMDERESENAIAAENQMNVRQAHVSAEIVSDDEGTDVRDDEITPEEKNTILKEMHDNPLGGHQGMHRTFERIKQYRQWKGMKRDIEEYIRKCPSCQKNKLTQAKTKMPLEITDTAKTVFEKCSMDIVGPLSISNNGNKYMLTFQDDLSKFTLAVPIERQDADTVAEAFVENIVLRYGIPSVLLTDQGSNFLSDVFKRVCKLLRITRIHTTAYHPESNGALERSHRTLIEYLRHFVTGDQAYWDKWLPYAIFVFNTTPHSSTGYTPFELMYGRKVSIPGVLQQESPKVSYDYESYVNKLRARMQEAHNVARDSIVQHKQTNKEHYDKRQNPKEFKIGDKVLLYDESVRRGRSRKLDSQWRGPFEVVKVDNPNVIIKVKRNKETKVHANRLKQFF